MRMYDVLTEECKERQRNSTGLMQLVVGKDDILYRCLEEVQVQGNAIKVTKYFPDGRVEESIRPMEG